MTGRQDVPPKVNNAIDMVSRCWCSTKHGFGMAGITVGLGGSVSHWRKSVAAAAIQGERINRERHVPGKGQVRAGVAQGSGQQGCRGSLAIAVAVNHTGSCSPHRTEEVKIPVSDRTKQFIEYNRHLARKPSIRGAVNADHVVRSQVDSQVWMANRTINTEYGTERGSGCNDLAQEVGGMRAASANQQRQPVTGHALGDVGWSREKRYAQDLGIDMVGQPVKVGMAGYAVEDLRIAAGRVKAMVLNQAADTGTKGLGRCTMTDIAAGIGSSSRITVIKRVQLPDAIFMQAQTLRRMTVNTTNQQVGVGQGNING